MIALSSRLFFQSPVVGLIGGLTFLILLAIFFRRRPAMPVPAVVCTLLGAMLLAFTCGDPIWQQPAIGDVTILVDRSASTRGANYRDRAFLMNRIRQLLGNARYRITDFSSGDAAETVYSPPNDDAIVVFTDGRFAPPAHSAPTYPVIDAALESPEDASVYQLELRGENSLAATVQNTGQLRRISFIGAANTDREPIAEGRFVLDEPLLQHTTDATAKFAAGDLWPENDSLSIRLPPPAHSPPWWIGGRTAGEGWQSLTPREMPSNAADFLSPPAIVLDNVSANEFSQAQLDRLEQYVRDLGGTLLIIGGDRAFSAGGYEGTRLDAISPLASSPPTPTTHWMLLIDASGSMADPVTPGATRFQLAASAVSQLLAQLPGDDIASVGSFARELAWWSAGKPAKETAKLSLPPRDIAPQGPTNLEAALVRIAGESDGKLPRQLLVLTDGETQITDAESLAKLLAAKGITLNFLALGHGSAKASIEEIAQLTGGKNLEQLEPTQWIDTARELYRQASPQRLIREPIDVRIGDVREETRLWNRTWSKAGASVPVQSQYGDETAPILSTWRYGAGEVSAIAFQPLIENAIRIAPGRSRQPIDLRYAVTWSTGPRLRVTIDTVTSKDVPDAMDFRLDLFDESTGRKQSHAMPLVGPGRYELTLPAPREATFATVNFQNTTLARRAIASRYAAEFDAIGNDRAALADLAARTGGEVIEPSHESAIDFHWPPRNIRLTPWVATIGMLLLAAGLVVWRRA